MRVLLLNRSDVGGGAAKAACRLLGGLRKIGLKAVMLVGRKMSDYPHVIGPGTKLGKVWQKIVPALDAFPGKVLKAKNSGTISYNWLPDGIHKKTERFHPDIINIHWVGRSFLRPESLSKMKYPLVWTLHDMWAFLGAEHLAGDSRRYKEGYLRTNRPAGHSCFDLERWVWKRKLKSWTGLDNLTIVAPSRWMAKCAKESVLFRNKTIEVIPNGVDHHLFKPLNRSLSRQILGLPQEKKLILISSLFIDKGRHKGMNLFKAAVSQLGESDLTDKAQIMVIGASSQEQLSGLNFKVISFGRLFDEISLALIYAAADVLVQPSREDNLPNTVLEALSCGTPVVAFDIGGMSDMIEHQQNGYMARPFDVNDLAAGIMWVLSDHSRWQSLSRRSREKIEREFTLQMQAQRYTSLFEDILLRYN
jgi:glycosyltransferase involved in cell wall biosynthesis